MSISLSDREREVLNKFSGSELKEKLAKTKRQDLMLKSSVLAGQQQQQMSHLKATDGQQMPKAERGVERVDSKEFFRKYWSDGQSGCVDESKRAIPKMQRRMDPEIQSYFPRQVSELQEREVTFNVQPVGSQQNRWSTFGNLGESTPVRNQQANETYD